MSNSILYVTFGGLGAGGEKKQDHGIWIMVVHKYLGVFVKLESGSARPSVNFPCALGSLRHPTEETHQGAKRKCTSP